MIYSNDEHLAKQQIWIIIEEALIETSFKDVQEENALLSIYIFCALIKISFKDSQQQKDSQ